MITSDNINRLPDGVDELLQLAQAKLENCKTIYDASIIIDCIEKILRANNVQCVSTMTFKTDDTFGDTASAVHWLTCEVHIFKEGCVITTPYKKYDLELVVKLIVYDHTISCELTRHTEHIDDRTGGYYSYNKSINILDNMSLVIEELDEQLRRSAYKRKFANVDQVIESFVRGCRYTPKQQTSYKQQIIDFITKLLPD